LIFKNFFTLIASFAFRDPQGLTKVGDVFFLTAVKVIHAPRRYPGGIDFDGNNIWVPVCEYRPFGNSIIYKVNPFTMQATAMDTLHDAIGAVT